MGKTSISWTMGDDGVMGKTWNPTRGCRRVSDGCMNCYAERQAARFSGKGLPYEGLIKITKKGPRWSGKSKFVVDHLSDPLEWRKPKRIFVDSMSDLFYEGFSNKQIAAVFGIMAAARQHTFQVLTKRPERMKAFFVWLQGVCRGNAPLWCWGLAEEQVPGLRTSVWASEFLDVAHTTPWPLPNVWLGVSVENQETADERIPLLIQTPAVVRFLSCEPLLGAVNLQGDEPPPAMRSRAYLRGMLGDERVGWVIAGAESGPRSRPCDVAWLRILRDQCAATKTAFFLKQAKALLENNHNPFGMDSGAAHFAICGGDGSTKKGGGLFELPYLDGIQHAEFPQANASREPVR